MDKIDFNTKMREDFSKIILSEEQIQKRVSEIGAQITHDYKALQEDGILVMCILKGAFVFMSDLCKNIDLKIQMDFMAVSSYGNSTKSSGNVKINMDLSDDINGKHIIIAEDIIDSGRTLNTLIGNLYERGAKTVNVAAFLHKNISEYDIPVKYKCFDCPNEFIVGYGLDYAQYYRNLPFISGLGE